MLGLRDESGKRRSDYAMPRIRETLQKWEKRDLDQDGIVSAAIQDVIHDVPHPVHYDRAAEAVQLDRAEIPAFETVADLLAFVLSVRAAAGDDKAVAAIIDRFSPKAARSANELASNTGASAPSSSDTPEDKQAAEDYMSALRPN